MNRVVLMGRLTRDPEVRYTQSGKSVASFSLAVDRRFARRDAAAEGQQTADFINIVAWEKTAEFVSHYFKKGNRMLLEGRLQVRNYDAKDGTKRTIAEVVADNVEFCESKSSSSNTYRDDSFPTDNDYPGDGGASAKPAANDFGNEIPDEDIPF